MAKKTPVKLTHQIAVQSLTLFVTSLGFVSALAWNEAIKEYIDIYIKPYFARGSSVWSLFLYAVVITVIAVLVTLQLNRLTRLIENHGRSSKG